MVRWNWISPHLSLPVGVVPHSMWNEGLCISHCLRHLRRRVWGGRQKQLWGPPQAEHHRAAPAGSEPGALTPFPGTAVITVHFSGPQLTQSERYWLRNLPSPRFWSCRTWGVGERVRFLCCHFPRHSHSRDKGIKPRARSIAVTASETEENSVNSSCTFPGRGPAFIILAYFCTSMFGLRPSQEVEKYCEKGSTCGLSGLTGYRKYSNCRENMFT